MSGVLDSISEDARQTRKVAEAMSGTREGRRRPGRTEPRAVKRRPKSYKLLNKPRHLIQVPAHHNRPNPRARRHP